MDKSEGTDFFSKLLSPVTDKVSKWYHTSQKKVSLSSLKRARNEKITALGNKALELMKQNKMINESDLEYELEAIKQVDEAIAMAQAELETIKKAGTEEKQQDKKEQKKAKKTKNDAVEGEEAEALAAVVSNIGAKKATTKKSAAKKNIATGAKKATVKKSTAKKTSTKKPVAKKTSENKPEEIKLLEAKPAEGEIIAVEPDEKKVD